CPHGTWTLRWETPVNYSIDAPLVFTGSFRQALEQLFALYTPAESPLCSRRAPIRPGFSFAQTKTRC
ncbi:TcpQ domain-containing protein, partial [Escherichia coli]